MNNIYLASNQIDNRNYVRIVTMDGLTQRACKLFKLIFRTETSVGCYEL